MKNENNVDVQQLLQAFESCPVRFRDEAAALAAFKESHIIEHGEEGVTTFYDGEKLPLADALARFGYDRRALIDGRTLPREGIGTARPGLMSKADLTTTKQKTDFITRHGLDAYERLPLQGVGTREVVTLEDWRQLPRLEKVRRLNEDPQAMSKLKPAPPKVVGGVYIAHDKIAKIQSVRPGGRLG